MFHNKKKSENPSCSKQKLYSTSNYHKIKGW